MVILYRVYGFDNKYYGLSSTETALEEEKEKIINIYLTRTIKVSDKYIWIKIEDLFKNNNINDINLEEIVRFEYVSKEKLNIILRAYRKRDNKQKYRKQCTIREENIKGKRLKFNGNWDKYARPSIVSSADNVLIQELSNKYSIDIEETVDIIKYLSMFTIESMKIKRATRIPILGAFKTKKHIYKKEMGVDSLYKIKKNMREDTENYDNDNNDNNDDNNNNDDNDDNDD